MAFKNARYSLQTTRNDIYTCPAGKEAVVFGIMVANKDATNKSVVTATLEWYDSSGAAYYNFGPEAMPIAYGGAEKDYSKLALEAGDKISGKCSLNDGIEVTLSVIELDLPA